MGYPVDYYRQSRPELLRFIPASTKRLMDIGCGEGRFGEAVKMAIPDCETWGVEPNATAAAAASKCNDRIFNKDACDLGDLPANHFDVVTMNDVLEHIAYPEPVLEVVKRIIKHEGRLILSLPNVRYYLNVRDLVVRGDWEYRDSGILDRTHLRFFTPKSAVRLLTENGFQVDQVAGLNASRLKFHYRCIFALAPRSAQEMQYPQFAVVSRLRN